MALAPAQWLLAQAPQSELMSNVLSILAQPRQLWVSCSSKQLEAFRVIRPLVSEWAECSPSLPRALETCGSELTSQRFTFQRNHDLFRGWHQTWVSGYLWCRELAFAVRPRGACSFLALSCLLFWSWICPKEIVLMVRLEPCLSSTHPPAGGAGGHRGDTQWQSVRKRKREDAKYCLTWFQKTAN